MKFPERKETLRQLIDFIPKESFHFLCHCRPEQRDGFYHFDFAFSARLIDHLTFKFSAKDLLNRDHKFVQRTLEGDKTAQLKKTGRGFSAGFTYQF